jgi:hypothetical protein
MGAVSLAIRKPTTADRAPSVRKTMAGNTLRITKPTMDVQGSREFNRRTQDFGGDQVEFVDGVDPIALP